MLLLVGCVAGPNYHVPATAVLNHPNIGVPFMGQDDARMSQEELPRRWWRLYGDPKLDSYVEEALAANTDLRAADANLHRATAIVHEAEAARTMRTNISGQAVGARVAGPADGLPAPFSYSMELALSYPLDLAGTIHRGVEASSAQAGATLAARDQVRIFVAAAVTRSYARVCAMNVTLAAARHVVEIQQSTLEVATRLTQSGRGTRFDVDRAGAAVHVNNAAIPDILAERTAALYELAALMGRTPADYPKAVETCNVVPTIDRPIPIGDGAMLIRRRPDIRRAERLLAAATATIGIEAAELYPKISIGGFAGAAGPADELLKSASFGFSVGPLVSWSFPNRKAVRARIEQAGAAADGALASFDGAVLLAVQQTETALAAYTYARDRLDELELAATAAGRASDDAEKLQRFGRTPFLDVLNAQASFADAQTSLSAARAHLIDRQIDLFLALGGGWE
jgi:NodT family efflux transporter outer membrane factor (OMF) lipoprotein